MRRGVEMGSSSETQTNEGEEGSDRMDDQNRREGFPRIGREVEVVPGRGYITWDGLGGGNLSGEEHELGLYRTWILVHSFPLQ